MTELKGWILDVYADLGRGAVVWVVAEDGRRLRLTQEIAITFYVGGEETELVKLCRALEVLGVPYERTTRKHLFHGLIQVIAITLSQGAQQRALFRKIYERFPVLDYYNADVALPVHYFVMTGTFPLAFCSISMDGQRITSISTSDNKWSLAQKFPALRVMEIEPNSPPQKSNPTSLRITFDGKTQSLGTKDPVQLLRGFSELLTLYDPDILRTRYGDAWMFPHLLAIAQAHQTTFNPNRDKSRRPLHIEANQFESYGRLVHRDQQTLLFGRLHLDPQNSLSFDDWGLEGTYETARLSNLPIQNAARRSAGGAFVGMQVTASLEKGILIPIRKEQRERFKTANQLISADNGGVIFKPIAGLYPNVAEIDFFSMYPSIMALWNISAETVGGSGAETRMAPGIGAPINQDEPGIVGEILKPILRKRAAAKAVLESQDFRGLDPNYVKTAYDFIKGLGWVSYGYQGFSGNRIGSIEAHEAINAVSRDVILRAKEAAEDAGYRVLHIYVDSLFVSTGHHREGMSELLLEIERRTGLRADLEGILRWIAFLPSKQNERVPVPNCFFGVFRNGKIKCRGIMARRGDTPKFIAELQLQAIERMASVYQFKQLPEQIPDLVQLFKTCYVQVENNEIPIETMLIDQTLSRNLEDVKAHSPASLAANQLLESGKSTSAGQRVEFVRIKGKPSSMPVQFLDRLDIRSLDTTWYCGQLIRAASEVLQPLGVPNQVVSAWLSGHGAYWLPTDFIDKTPKPLPLLAS